MKKILAEVARSFLSVSRPINANRQMQSSAVPASNSLEEHAEHSEQHRLEQQPSAMVEPTFATMQTDNAAEHEGSSEINPTKCDWSWCCRPCLHADVEMCLARLR